mmetsp:Transcript_24490/g.60837  ORF Transcript_24490/g.60837 Transcript_24490/m.60837 type:complete len:115 (+) Transcript_24490:218-562(+)
MAANTFHRYMCGRRVARLRGLDADDQANAANALARLARDDANLRAFIVAAGALPLLVELLRAGSEAGKSNAVAVIAELAQDAPNRATIVPRARCRRSWSCCALAPRDVKRTQWL